VRATPLPQDDNWVGRGGEHMWHVTLLGSESGNDFLGGTAGPYIWGKENSTPGVGGSQGNLEWLGEGVGSLRGLHRCLGFIAALDALRHPEP
jgi:hypothetical protein